MDPRISSPFYVSAEQREPVSYTHLDVYKRQTHHSAPNLLTFHPKIQTLGLIPCQILNRYVSPFSANWAAFGRYWVHTYTYLLRLYNIESPSISVTEVA